MANLAWIFALSFAIGLLLTPLARALGKACRLVDHPDGRRKLHTAPIPVSGGIAIFAATSLALLIGLQTAAATGWFLMLLLASVAVCALGVADDKGLLRGKQKLIGQLLIAIFVVFFCDLAVQSVRVFEWQVELTWLAVPFMVFWLLGTINSLNLLDGMDGLLGSLAIVIFLALGVLAFANGHSPSAQAAVAVAGAVLAFLIFNFPPASIFLGDSGSMLLGLLAGTLALRACTGDSGTMSLIVPLALFTLPVFDTLAAIVRRKLTGRSLYATDRGHLHHCLRRRGLSPSGILLWVSGLGLLLVGGSLAATFAQREWYALPAPLFVVAALIGTRTFGSMELLLIWQRLSGLAAAFSSSSTKVVRCEVHLQGSADWKGLFDAIIAQAAHLQLSSIRLDINAPAIHEGYYAHWQCNQGEAEESAVWRAEIPLVFHGRPVGNLAVTGVLAAEPMWRKIARLTELMQSFEGSELVQAHGHYFLNPPHVHLRRQHIDRKIAS